MTRSSELFKLASQYHDALPDHLRRYLNDRGIPDPVIDLNLIGWNGDRITIPVRDRDGRVLFFRLAKDPDDPRPGPKMLTPAWATAELYGWERIRSKPSRVIICEGEFDRLVLEAHGFPAITSTAGAGVFRDEWADALKEIPDVFICFDRDDAGRSGARRLTGLIPRARIVNLPEVLGEGGDVSDFFVGHGHGREEFEHLLAVARPLPSEKPTLDQPKPAPTRPHATSDRTEIARLKADVSLGDVAAGYVHLRRSGSALAGLCPFHEDRRPSFYIYPDRNRFRCYGCGTRGDVIEFLMRIEHLNFPQAVETLRRLAGQTNHEGAA